MPDILYALLIIVFSAGLIYYKCNQAKIKGKLGESIVYSILKSLPNDYFLFNDVYLISGSRSIQIDHIVISEYGIFVIETKNYKGWIYGSEDSEYWTQNLYGNKHSFYNPIRQNKTHAKVLKRVLGVSDDCITPIVVFINRADLYCKTESIVIFASELKDVIYTHAYPIFSIEEVKRYVEKLSSAMIIDENRTRDQITDCIEAMAVWVLHNEFGFGQKRCLKFMKRFMDETECLVSEHISWKDIIDVLHTKIKTDIKIRLNEVGGVVTIEPDDIEL